jgi:hypothetical protein
MGMASSLSNVILIEKFPSPQITIASSCTKYLFFSHLHKYHLKPISLTKVVRNQKILATAADNGDLKR